MATLQYWQVNAIQDDLEQARAELRAAKKALGVVTGEVSATGENLNKSDSALRSELKALNSELKTANNEIRKLWDLANKRNRKNISSNEQGINALEKKLEKVNAQAGKAMAATAESKTAIDALNQKVRGLTTDQLAASSEITAAFEKFSSQLKQLDELYTEQKQLQEQQQATEKSMDAFRLRVNRQILQLEASFRELTQAPDKALKFQQ